MDSGISLIEPVDSAPPFPTAAELQARIPAEGITISDLLKSYKSAVADPAKKARFIEMMRGISKYDGKTRLLFPKGA